MRRDESRPHFRRPGSPAAAAPVSAGGYQVDPERSLLSFRAKAFGLVWVRGTMPAVDGSVRIEDGRLSGAGVIAASEVDTGVKARDWHLRAPTTSRPPPTPRSR